MQVTITGPRGGGGTRLAAEIGRLLRSKGADVRFVGLDVSAAAQLEELADQPAPIDWRGSRVSIVDGCEQEDESDAGRRAARAARERRAPTC